MRQAHGAPMQPTAGTHEAVGRVNAAVVELDELANLVSGVRDTAGGVEAATAGRVAAAAGKLDGLVAAVSLMGGGGAAAAVEEWSARTRGMLRRLDGLGIACSLQPAACFSPHFTPAKLLSLCWPCRVTRKCRLRAPVHFPASCYIAMEPDALFFGDRHRRGRVPGSGNRCQGRGGCRCGCYCGCQASTGRRCRRREDGSNRGPAAGAVLVRIGQTRSDQSAHTACQSCGCCSVAL